MRYPIPKLTARRIAALLAAVLAVALAGCGSKTENEASETPAAGKTAPAGVDTFRADIHALNPSLTGGGARGRALVTVHGDTVTFDVQMAGVGPDMPHMQHLHGYVNGDETSCPGLSADENGDGIFDDTEAEKASGPPLIPLNGDPAKLAVADQTYPRAAADSTYHYHRSVSLKTLTHALEQQKEMDALHLDRLVIFVHGVPDGMRLPDTVAAPPGAPVKATVPIACGHLERVSR